VRVRRLQKGTASRRTQVDVADLEARLREAEETLRAIRNGEADALVVAGPDGDQIFALKGAEQPYRVLVETMNDGAVTLLHDGTIAYSNRCFAHLIGTPLEQVIGTTFATFVAPDQQVRLASLLARASKSGLQGDLTMLASDGARVPAQLALSPLRIDEAQGTCLIIRNMTDGKRAEGVLREQAELLDLAYDAIIVRDLEDHIVFWNKGAEDTYAWTAAQALGRLEGTLLRTTFPAPRESIEATLCKLGRWEGELHHQRCDGRTIVVASRRSLQYDEQGAPKAVLEINRDITERKRADETIRLQSAQHATMRRLTTTSRR
jgi:PAS domain S-box-containing protein